MKFGMQHYFNVMDEVVTLMEDTILQEEHSIRQFRQTSLAVNRDLHTNTANDLVLPEPKPHVFRENKSQKAIHNRNYKSQSKQEEVDFII